MGSDQEDSKPITLGESGDGVGWAGGLCVLCVALHGHLTDIPGFICRNHALDRCHC